MTKDIDEIREKLKSILEGFVGPLVINVDKPTNFELKGNKEAQQGKKTVDGIYFCSVVPKAKDVRFYFYPRYTHPDVFDGMSEQLTKFLKGKTCFHIKFLDKDLEKEIKDLIKTAIKIYKKDGLLK